MTSNLRIGKESIVYTPLNIAAEIAYGEELGR